ncbi:MAG: glycosyltransferase family 2 protein [Fimbriiglobus sp.]
MPMIVSVIVPVRNEAKSLEATLRKLLTQDYPQDRYEVIVADGVSTDGTVPIVRRLQGEFPNLRLVFNPDRFSSAGRNTAIRHMIGDAAVIVDGHCHVPDADYLTNLVEALQLSGADTLGRPQPLNSPNPTPFQEAVSLARSSRLGHNPDSDIFSDEAKFVAPQSTAVVYRREVFAKIGLFDQAFDACEDVEFNQRVAEAELTCYFTPKIKIEYHPRQSWPALFKQLGRYGTGRARLAAKNPKSLTLPALVPPGWVVWLVGGGLLSFLHPWFLALYATSLVVYFTTIVLGSLWLGRQTRPRVASRLPGIFLAIHLGFAYGFLREASRQLTRKR